MLALACMTAEAKGLSIVGLAPFPQRFDPRAQETDTIGVHDVGRNVRHTPVPQGLDSV